MPAHASSPNSLLHASTGGKVRPDSRERLLSCGACALSDAELVTLFIGTGAGGRTCAQVSADLLRRAGSLRELLLLQPPSAQRLPGLGAARYARLQSALELARRARQSLETLSADAHHGTRARLITALTDLPVQSFAVAFLQAGDQCIVCERMFHGTLRFVHVHPREVVSRAIALRATAVSVGRSDPEGSPLENESDQMLRTQLIRALELVGVELREFLIVGQSCDYITLAPAAELESGVFTLDSARAPHVPQQFALDLSYPGQHGARKPEPGEGSGFSP